MTEQDLIEIFGRVIIDSTLATALKAQVRKSTKSFVLQEQIALVTGAGPTVHRAFADDQSHALAMVVQCSFLASVHKIDSLAAAVANYLERLDSEAPNTIDYDASLLSQLSTV